MIEIVLIVVVLLLVFGASKVRSAGSDLGAAVKGFRKGLTGPAAPPPAAAPADPNADAEFPEQVAARKGGSGKPGA